MSLVHVRIISGVTVAKPPADVAMENARAIHDELEAAISNASEGLVLDLAETRFLDSAGIDMIFELREQLANRRQRLALVAPETAPLRRVLELTGVEKAVIVTGDLATAVQAASDPAQGAPSAAN